MAKMKALNRQHEAGFIRAYDAQAARRQLQISATLVALLALAAAILGFLARAETRPLSHALGANPRGVAETLLDSRS